VQSYLCIIHTTTLPLPPTIIFNNLHIAISCAIQHATKVDHAISPCYYYLIQRFACIVVSSLTLQQEKMHWSCLFVYSTPLVQLLQCICSVWMLGFVCFVLFFSLAECYWHCYRVEHQCFSTAAVVLYYAHAVPSYYQHSSSSTTLCTCSAYYQHSSSSTKLCTSSVYYQQQRQQQINQNYAHVLWADTTAYLRGKCWLNCLKHWHWRY